MTENLDPKQLRAVAEAATPGPWEHQPYGEQNQNGDHFGGWLLDSDGEFVVSDVSDRDGAHMATFDPETVLALLSRLEQAEQQVASVREVIRQYDMACLTCQCDSDGDCCKCTVADFQEALDGEQGG